MSFDASFVDGLSDEIKGRLNGLLTGHQPFLQEVWQAMRMCLHKASFETDIDLIPRPEKAKFKLIDDPFDHSEVIEGEWRNKWGAKQGEIRLRADGTIYAELDVIRNHPTDVRWFVEAVTVWGSQKKLKSELRMLPISE